MTSTVFTTRALQGCVVGMALALCSATSLQAQPSTTAPLRVASVASADQRFATALTAVPDKLPAAITPPAGVAVGNPYGLRSVWEQGDPVAQTTLLILAAMSLLSWYLIVAKWLAQRRLARYSRIASRVFAGEQSLRQRSETLAPSNPFRIMTLSALEALRRHGKLCGQVELGQWLSQDIVHSVSTLQMRSQEGLSVLATVGATAPFVGLFGTVWGIYNALVTIGVSGQASIDKVAGPVGEALIMTALGLAVAVPAVLAYNALGRRNRVLLHEVKGFASELHTQLLEQTQEQQHAALQGPGD